jgi:hypothetical protein
MSDTQQRSVLNAPFDVSVIYPAGNVGNNLAGYARVSLIGNWTGGVVLKNRLADGEWTVVKNYQQGPEDDIAAVCTSHEEFIFEADSTFSGQAKVIVAQDRVLP